MTAQQLKNSILQLAVQGKLVPQDPNDEPASVLLERITKERERLIKEKKIKKPKTTSRIFRRDGHYYESVNGGEPACIDEQIPFDIPESWEWVRLSHIVYNHGQEKPESDFSYIDIGSIDNKRQKLNQTENIICADKAPSRARKIVHWGDILYSTVRPYLHNMCIVDKAFSKTPIASTGFAVLCPFSGIYNAYLFYYLMSPEFDSYANDTENAKGVAYPAINDDRLYRALIPIPPSVEQQRIVARFENILSEIYQYDELSIKSESLEKGFPDALKKSILQHAIQGKLVPQDPTDEPASVLLERIAKERAKKGKNAAKSMSRIERRDRGTYEIFPDGSEKDISGEIPFDIPDSWEWCRMNNCLDVRDGTHDTPAYVTQGIPLITSKNLKNGSIDFSSAKMISLRDHQSISERSHVDSGDIMFAMIGSIGNPVLYKGNDVFSIKNMALFKQIENGLNMEYVLMWLTFQQSDIRKQAAGGVQSFVSLNYLRNYLIPVPPLNEQHRIVEKLGVLMNELGATK